MKVYILRHGQTDANKKYLLQGRSDLPLNDTGILQAREAGEGFRRLGITFTEVYSSPLQRAVQTAQYAAEGIPLRTDDRLLEMDYGPYEGTDLRSMPEEVIAFFHDFANTPAPAGMEQLSQVTARLGTFLEELKQTAPEGNILLSTHAIALKGALEYLMPEAHGKWWSTHIGNCAVFVTELTEDGYTEPQEVILQKGE